MSDPSNSDVSAAAVWSSSAPLVADVTGGTVRALSPGEAEISASYLGAVAKTLVNISPLMSLDGIVHETSPTEATPIGDALIMVIGGRFDGRQTRTASDGRFRLFDVAGVVRVRVGHEGFQTYEMDVNLATVRTLDVALAPPNTPVTDVYSFSTGYQPGDPPIRSGDEFPFAIHSSGIIQVTLDSWRTPYDGDFLTVDLIRSATVLGHLQNCDALDALLISECTASRLPDGFTITSAEPGIFVLKIASERRLILAYHIRVTHPR
jgi:hypothetical protein